MPDLPPLTGIKVLEFAGLAPGPFAGMFLADAGADVLRIDRAVPSAHAASSEEEEKLPPPTDDHLTRRKASIAVNLKDPAGVALVRTLATSEADVLIDPFRPGVLERLGLGPDELLARNPRLVYARLSGFRRDGRYRDMAGHDINYLAVSGALSLLGRAGAPPTPPANILADFAGGGLMLVVGVLLALRARELPGGKGQVVEASMVDGASYLATFSRLARKRPGGDLARGHNLLDSGCPYYDTYETSDGGHMAVGALEPAFFAVLVDRLGLADQGWPARRHDRAEWPALRSALANAFRSRTRAAWERVFDGTDACCTPVLTYAELEHSQTAAATATATTDDADTREGDQRPAVGLRDTPLYGLDSPQDGYTGKGLRPGEGGEAVLERWCGWRRGVELDVVGGGLVLQSSDKARL